MPDVCVANEHCAFVGVIEAEQEVGEAGFAGAGAADQSNELAGLDDQVDVVEHGLLTIGEAHVFETDRDAAGLERLGVGWFGQCGLLRKQLIDRFDGGTRQTQLALETAQVLHRRI